MDVKSFITLYAGVSYIKPFSLSLAVRQNKLYSVSPA
jgi:hypothetical protein